jgi:hypothetical protein
VEGQYPEANESNVEERHKTAPGQDDFEILKESPHLGDGKFKLEIGLHWPVFFILSRSLAHGITYSTDP